jgi:hypothetical protein
MTIYHPFLADPCINITSVIVEDVMQPVRDGETGGWIIEIKFIKYQALKVQQAKYEGTKDQPMDEQDRRNQAKAAQNDQKRASLAALQGKPLPAPK